MTRYSPCWRLDGPHVRPRRLRKTSPPPVFDPRTVQHVANRYTDYFIPPHTDLVIHKTKLYQLLSFVYHGIKVEIELCEYTNLTSGDCDLFQCPVAVFAWTEKEIQYPPAGSHETRLTFEL
jgi:hypothetical protein